MAFDDTLDLSDDQIVPFVTPDEKLAAAMLGTIPGQPPAQPVQPPASAASAYPIPLAPNFVEQPPSPQPGPQNPVDRAMWSMMSVPQPPGPATRNTATLPVPPTASATPQLPPGAALPIPPQHDMDAHNRLLADLKSKQGAPLDNKIGWGDRIRAMITAAAAGYGRDPGAISRGLQAGTGVYDRKRNDAQQAHDTGVQQAKEAVDQHEYDEGLKEKQYGDAMTGYRDYTARQGEQNRERAETRQQQALDEEIDPKAKAVKVTDDQGKERWMVRTKGGNMVETSAPDKKTFHSAYERSQSSDPTEAAQGRKDYNTEEHRRDVRTANDTTRANAAKENADKKGQGKGQGKDAHIAHYNDKVDKARKSLNEAVGTVKAIPNWESKPVLKNQVQNAYDDFNGSVEQYYKEYQSEAGDNASLVAPAHIPYPWEKGGQGAASAPKQVPPQKPAPPASAANQPTSGRKEVQSYTAKSGETYTKGQRIESGRYAGKTILKIYEDGKVDLQ